MVRLLPGRRRQHHTQPARDAGHRRRRGDPGVKVAATTSNGDFHDRPYVTEGETKRLRRLQQRLSRCKRGSNRRRAVRAKINAITGRVRNRRADFCAQTAHTLTTRNAVVALEDLRTQNMTASASGTASSPAEECAPKPD
ncbi:transposase [Streptomyces sp. NPDC051976]|uniref:transposase n=1 Tax=Streptomyces sp. NPDC051976 TaxID=3154947 RepID=UPI003441D486